VTPHDNNKHVSVLVSRNLKHQLLLARSPPPRDPQTGTLRDSWESTGHTLGSYLTDKMLTCDCTNEEVSPLRGRVGELRL
jgi:hypothetical protein